MEFASIAFFRLAVSLSYAWSDTWKDTQTLVSVG